MATVIFIIVFFGLIFVFSSMETKENSENKKKEEDVVVDAFIAVVKLTPDLHVSSDNVKKRMISFAETALISIDGEAGSSRARNNFAPRIDKREKIKVKELGKKITATLKGFDFQYKKEILIGMWSLAYADGQATVDQQKLISIIGKAMGLSITACNKIETMFWQRMKAGKFGDYKEFEKRRDKWFEDE